MLIRTIYFTLIFLLFSTVTLDGFSLTEQNCVAPLDEPLTFEEAIVHGVEYYANDISPHVGVPASRI